VVRPGSAGHTSRSCRQTRRVQSGWFEKFATLFRVLLRTGMAAEARPRATHNGFEHPGGKGRVVPPRGSAEVDPLLGRDVLAVEPDGQAAARLDSRAATWAERPARVGAVVHHADREREVELPLGQGEVEEVPPGRSRRSGRSAQSAAAFSTAVLRVDPDHVRPVSAQRAWHSGRRRSRRSSTNWARERAPRRSRS